MYKVGPNNKQQFSLNTELSNQKIQQKFYESKYYQFKTIDQFHQRQLKNINSLEQKVLKKDQLKLKLHRIKQQKQFQEDKQVINNLKNQKFDFEKVQEKGQLMFLKKMGFNKQNIPDLNFNLSAKQLKEQKQSLQKIQKQMMSQINLSIRQLEKKNNEKFDQFKQQVNLYNNFYCTFLTDEKDRFEQFLNKHKLNVSRLKYFDQGQKEQTRTNESNKLIGEYENLHINDSNSSQDQSELNQYLQTQFIDTNDMVAENEKYLKMIDEFNFDYHGKSKKEYFKLVQQGKIHKLKTMLISEPELIDAVNYENMNGLHVAILRYNMEMIQFLLSRKVNLYHQDIIKRTPIQLALQINEEYPSSLTIKIKNYLLQKDKEYKEKEQKENRIQ